MSTEPRSVQLQNEHRDDGSQLSLDAAVEEDGSLRISGHDLGPVAAFYDGEYEYWYTVAAEDVPALAAAFGGDPDEHIIEVLERRFSGPGTYDLYTALRASGVPYKFWCWP